MAIDCEEIHNTQKQIQFNFQQTKKKHTAKINAATTQTSGNTTKTI